MRCTGQCKQWLKEGCNNCKTKPYKFTLRELHENLAKWKKINKER